MLKRANLKKIILARLFNRAKSKEVIRNESSLKEIVNSVMARENELIEFFNISYLNLKLAFRFLFKNIKNNAYSFSH